MSLTISVTPSSSQSRLSIHNTISEPFKSPSIKIKTKSQAHSSSTSKTLIGDENKIRRKKKSYEKSEPEKVPENNIESHDEIQGQFGGDGDNMIPSPCQTSRSLDKPHFEAMPLLKQRLGYFWETKMFTDVVFKVGPGEEPIEAHRMILASGSEIFQELLYEAKPMITDGKFELYEPDFSVPAFHAFIKAFYTNEISICLTLPMALEVFYASKKYKVGFLQDQILNHIRTAVTVSNVFEALRVSTNMLELTFMVPVCWNIIEGQTEEVLQYYLETIDSKKLIKIMERHHLNLEEVQLFQFLVKWGGIQCKKRGLKTTAKNKRQIIDPLLKNIRFTTMTPTQINDTVVPSRILEPKEIQAILSHFSRNEPKQPIPYKTQIRFRPNNWLRACETFSALEQHSTKLPTAATSDSVVDTMRSSSAKAQSKSSTNTSKTRTKRGSIPTPRLLNDREDNTKLK